MERDVSEGDVDVLLAVASYVSGRDWVLDSGASYHMTPIGIVFLLMLIGKENQLLWEMVQFASRKALDPCKFGCLTEWFVLSLMCAMFRDYGSHLSLWDSWIL